MSQRHGMRFAASIAGIQVCGAPCNAYSLEGLRGQRATIEIEFESSVAPDGSVLETCAWNTTPRLQGGCGKEKGGGSEGKEFHHGLVSFVSVLGDLVLGSGIEIGGVVTFTQLG